MAITWKRNEAGPEIWSARILPNPMGLELEAIEGEMLPGVLGIDDEGTRSDGARLLTLLLNNAAESRIPLIIGGEEVPRG